MSDFSRIISPKCCDMDSQSPGVCEQSGGVVR